MYIPRLKKEYKEVVISKLVDHFSYDNVMQVPKLLKIVISKGVGAAVNDKKLVEHAINEITEILKICDAGRYSPQGDQKEHDILHEVGKVLAKIDKEF